ncbi:MAG: hypothetical protein WBA35_11065, partial [Litorimonas sp.]
MTGSSPSPFRRSATRLNAAALGLCLFSPLTLSPAWADDAPEAPIAEARAAAAETPDQAALR